MNVEQRADLYRLLGALMLTCPAEELLAALTSARTLHALGEAAGEGALGEALERMAVDLDRDSNAFADLRRDHIALFAGPKRKLAPPWESVYRSADRIVMQESAAEVLRAYASQRIGFEGMGARPADHAGFEFEFVSILIGRSKRNKRAREAVGSFVADHLLLWVPAWAADIRKHATTEFMRGFGEALGALCEVERQNLAAAGMKPRGRLSVQPS